MIELKPCPFCGGEVSLKDMGYFLMISRANRSSCKCGVFLESRAFTRDNLGAMERAKDRLIEKWNRRFDGWHTGTPTDEGWYLIQTKGGDFMAVEKNAHGLWLEDNYGYREVHNGFVVAWQKIEPFKEENNGCFAD